MYILQALHTCMYYVCSCDKPFCMNSLFLGGFLGKTTLHAHFWTADNRGMPCASNM